MLKIKKLIALVVLLGPTMVMAQGENAATAFSLQDCIDYALQNAIDVQNAKLDEQSAEFKVKETVGIGLPQVTGNVTVQKSPTQQRFFSTYNPPQPGEEQGFSFISEEDAQSLGMEAGDVFAAQNFFQLKSNGNASLGVNQLIFNGSYIVGLQASRAFKELSIRQTSHIEGERAATVAKAYFNVLINEDRLKLFSSNVDRLQVLYDNTVQMQKNGFAEQIDVDRIRVSLNNIESEEENFKNLLNLSISLLKFQMNYPLDQPLELSGTIEDVLSMSVSNAEPVLDVDNRRDYQVLLANKRLQELNIKNKYAEALPFISGFATLGYSTQSGSFGGLFRTESDFNEVPGLGPDQWYGYSVFGLRLGWNIFTGFQRSYQIQQQKVALAKMENSIDEMENAINIEVEDASSTFSNALEKLDVQRENMELAQRISNITQIKFEEGVGSNLEVVDANNSLKEAQTNYYNALFEAVIAKIDLSRALGTTE
ncbi:TolC family protein [Marinoscillum sp. MHG1-6]|uniref:TolC family protein n=1 Tax=Marinoscillum sp. MHG1-6 TaxID=2959627 RepID=UPI002157DAFE|nr:TolC family protein [Marinoscillum sp. MHG1-6]